MSLINEMLKNLDQRRETGSCAARSPLAGLTPATAHAERRKNAWIAACGVIGILIGTSFLIMAVGTETGEIPSVELESAAVPSSWDRWEEPSDPQMETVTNSWLARPLLPAVSAATANASEPAQLGKVQIQSLGKHTEISFYLTREIKHQTDRTAEGRVLRIRLENTFLATKLPSLELENTPIAVIEATRTGTHLDIELDFRTPVRADSALITENGQTRLRVELESQIDSEIADRTLPTPPPAQKPSPRAAPESTPEKYAVPAAIAKNTETSGHLVKIVHPPTPSQKADQLYAQALDLVQQGSAEAACDRFRSALVAFSRHRGARTQLAATLIRLGRPEQALGVLAVGREHDPRFAPYALLQARILTDRNEIKKALKVLQSTAPKVDQNPEYHAFIAALYQRQERYAMAEGLYRKLLRRKPENSVWWMGLGISLEGERRNQAALMAYERAVKLGRLDPDSLHFMDRRIQALQKQ